MLGQTLYAKLVEAAYSVSLMGDEAGFGRGALGDGEGGATDAPATRKMSLSGSLNM